MNSTARKLFASLLTLMAFIFFLGSAAHSVVAQEPKAPVEKCPVCHNGHTIMIPCKQVAKYLEKHPEDIVGECLGVSDEKPSRE
jgi:hypothetical protein